MLSKEQLLAKRKFKTITLDVDELGGQVCLREMSGTQRDQFELSLREADESSSSVRALFVSFHLCDADGELFEFSDAEREQLGDNGPGSVLDFLFDKCRELSGMDESGN